MESETQGLSAILGRLEKLEKQNRRLRLTGIGILALCGAALLMGQAQPRTVKTLEAEQLLLKGPNGKIRAALYINPDSGQPRLVMRDEKGNDRAELFLIPDGTPFFILSDQDGWIRSRLMESGLNLLDPDATPRATFGAGGLTFYGKERKVMWSAP